MVVSMFGLFFWVGVEWRSSPSSGVYISRPGDGTRRAPRYRSCLDNGATEYDGDISLSRSSRSRPGPLRGNLSSAGYGTLRLRSSYRILRRRSRYATL